MIEYLIIGMVLNKALTGYDIKKEIELGIGNFYKVSYGSLYPTLKKLTEKGYLTLTEQTQVERLKKFYTATDSGRAVFMTWLTSPVDISAGTDAMLSRIFFFGELPREIRNQKLDEYEREIKKLKDTYTKIEAQFADDIKTDSGYFELSTLYYGLQTVQGMLRWIRHLKAQKSFSLFLD